MAKFLLKAVILVLTLFWPTVSYSQQVRYVLTKSIQDGVESLKNGNSQMFITFSDNTAWVCHGNKSGQSFPYQYHHKDGDNFVYYQVGRDFLNGSEFLNDRSLLVISCDRSYVNTITYFANGPYICVYRQKDEDSYENMYK